MDSNNLLHATTNKAEVNALIREIEKQQDLIDALSVLAMHDLCSGIGLDLIPTCVSYKDYLADQKEHNLNHHILTEKQYNLIVQHLKGDLQNDY